MQNYVSGVLHFYFDDRGLMYVKAKDDLPSALYGQKSHKIYGTTVVCWNVCDFSSDIDVAERIECPSYVASKTKSYFAAAAAFESAMEINKILPTYLLTFF